MADREFIIDIILKARDETARAFAAATGNMEAYDRLVDEQKRKVRDAGKAQGEYAKQLDSRQSSEEKLNRTLADSKLRNVEAANALQKLEQAQRKVAQAEAANDPARRASALGQVVKAQRELTDALAKAEGMNKGLATVQANRIAQETALQARLRQTAQIEADHARTERQRYQDRISEERAWQSIADTVNRETERSRSDSMKRLAQQDAQEVRDRATRRRQEQRDIEATARAEEQRLARISRVTSGARGPADVLARTDVNQTQEIRAARELAAARAQLVASGLSVEESERRIHAVRQQSLHDYGFKSQAERDAARVARDEAGAYRLVEEALRKVEAARRAESRSRGRPTGSASRPVDAGTRALADVGESMGGGGGGSSGGLLGSLEGVKSQFQDLDTSTKGFDSNIRNAFGFAVVTLIQPFAALLIGLVGTMGALASAAVAAGTALGVTFISGMAQGIPVIGLFAAAMMRLQNIMGYVTAQVQQQQQAFIAQYQYQQQAAMGINPIVIAEHNYSDALFASQMASQQVRLAQLALLTTRQQATRQLQQLIFQETNAKLAAEASSLAINDSQKALQQTIATGGDVQQAQLQLAQAHANHVQSVAQAQQAVADAAPGSIARQNIQSTVDQAARGVTQAQRAVVDSQFQLAQARAAIIQAQMAARGYNVATAAQLAWLRSQMTQTERSLADNITKIYQMFQGVHGRLRPVTDAILGAFIPLTGQIIKIFNDPRVFGALLNLGQRIGGAIRQITNTVFSSQSINNFIAILHAAADNLRPFATTISNLFRGIQSIVVAAIPFVHQFAGFISTLTRQFADWASSTRGQNWLKNFFDVAFRSLEAFINLGVAVVRMFAAIVGPGGGAQAGIGVVKNLTDWINHATDSINRHGKVWHDLQRLWQGIGPSLHALGTILGAIVNAFIELGTSTQGRQSLKGLADLVARVLIPAFVQFAQNMGVVTVRLLNFLDKHPRLEKMLVTLIAAVATISIGMKAIGLLFGPLAAVVGVVRTLATLLPEIDFVAIFASPLGVIGLAAAGIVAIAAATGNLKNLWTAIKQPFINIWNQIRQPLQQLGKDFLYFINSILSPFGVHLKNLGALAHAVVAGIISVFKFGFGTIGTIIGRMVRDALRVIGGLFRLIGDIVHGNIGKVLHDFVQIGKAMIDGIWTALTALPKLVIKAFEAMVSAVLKFLGISSPSRIFAKIGGDIVDGLFSGLKGLVHFGEHMLSLIGKSLGTVFHFFLRLGEQIMDAIVNGIKKVPGKIVHAVESLIPSPIKKAANAVGGLLPWNWNQGGAVPGYGGGDIVNSRVEPGEHIFTKEEVRNAGGHGPIFALRRALGGGGQGGPGGYADGGAVGSGQQMPQALSTLGVQNPHGQTTQGVTGLYGSVLANIQDFIKQSLNDWLLYWRTFNKYTNDNLNKVRQSFSDSFKQITSQNQDSWATLNKQSKDGLNQLLDNFSKTYGQISKDTFNVFWYIDHEANKALKAFNASPVRITLDPQPKFAEGGFVGKMGERGRDAVHALLGRGEAVLNWAHQKVVDPALRAYYGFGLPGLFKRVRGEHAGGGGEGFASGGYVSPFPKGTPITWERQDAGKDMVVPQGTPVLAMADGTITGIDPNWYNGQPLIEQSISNGPERGKYIYYAEGLTLRAGVGQNVRAGQVIGVTTSQPTGLEFGWGGGGTSTLRSQVAGGGDSAGPWSSTFEQFIMGLASGHAVNVSGIPGGAAGAAATWNQIKDIAAKGGGALTTVLSKAFKKVTDAANKYGQNKAGAAGGGGAGGAGSRAGTVPGPIVTASWFDDPQTASGHVHVPGFAELSNPPAAMNWSALGGLPMGEEIDVSYGGRTITVPRVDVGAGGPALPGAAVRAIDLTREAANMLPGFISAGLANVHWRDRHKKAFRKGGPVDRLHGMFDTAKLKAGEIPFIGHVGEWILNSGQQDRLARMMGTSKEKLKKLLGLSGKKDHYASGGVLTPDEIRAVAYAQGFRGSALDTAVQVAEAESGGDPNQEYHPGPQEDSKGLWQINIVGSANPQYASWNLYDPAQNAKAAWELSNGGRNWGPWTTYTSGRYASQPTGSGVGTPPPGGVGGGSRRKPKPKPPVYRTLSQIFGGKATQSDPGTPGVRGHHHGTPGGPHDIFTAPIITQDQPDSFTTALRNFDEAQAATTRELDTSASKLQAATRAHHESSIKKYAGRFNDALDRFMSNLDKMLGDSGIFALWSQALQDFATNQGTMVTLASEGVREIGMKLRTGPVPDAIHQAQTDLNSTLREIPRLQRLQAEEVRALSQTNDAIGRLQRQRTRHGLNQDQVKNLQRLVGYRQNLINLIEQADQQLGQALSDRLQKEQALFQAQTDQLLRGSHTPTVREIGAVTLGVDTTAPGRIGASFNNLGGVLRKVGPTIALGIAQMAQSIAQTLQDPRELGIADQAIIDATRRQHADLQKRYAEAAAKAQHDPRWRSVADDLLQQLEASVTAVVQAQAQALQDAISSQDTKQQIGNAALQMRDTIAQAIAGLSNIAGPANQFAASTMQIQTSQQRSAFIGQQIGAYQGLLGQAQAQGNVGAINTLTQTLEQLYGEMVQSVLATQQLITANRQLVVTIVNAQVQATSGFFTAAQGIAQTLGAITGSQNLPALINYAKEAGQALITQGAEAVATIQNALAPDATTGQYAFGANQGQAAGFLGQLAAAFAQGPQAFADTLAQMAPGMATFEAGLPQDQQQLFQSLVQSLIDNTTAQVNNTQQLQQLNATTNQQQFTSSAWTMFREAIFNGMGGLLPQYALTIPSMDTGGMLMSSGLLYGHKNETIVPASVNRQQIGTGGNTYENHLHVTNPTEVADPVYLSNRVAWMVGHDPNSR